MVRGVRPAVSGRRIVASRLSHDDILRGVTRRRFLAGLRGARIFGATRRAKNAVLELDNGRRLVVQPGMTGSLFVRRRPRPEDLDYAVLRARLDSGAVLIYHDVRRIGTLRLLAPREWAEWEARVGPEPLAEGFTARDLHRALGRTRQPIKKALMDQQLLAGVGNIYANEALFAAGIDPSRPAAAVSEAAWPPLHRALRRILRRAVEAEGSTIRDYRTGNGTPGGFQLALKVYGREGEPCVVCGTPLVGTHAIDARITVFCHRCQR